jgi:hypothetical protein
MQGFTVLAALGMSGNVFRIRDEFPGRAGSAISRMILNGSDLEVIGQERGKGFHVRLPTPQVMFVLESADVESWRDSMRELDGRVFAELITPSTQDGVANSWKVNETVPAFVKGDALPMTIVKIVVDDYGLANIFATPLPASEWSKMGMYFRFTFLPLTGWVGVTDGLPMDQLMALEEAIEIEASGDGDDEDEGEGEETEEDEDEEAVQTSALPPPPAPIVPAPPPPKSFMPSPESVSPPTEKEDVPSNEVVQ